LIEEVDQRLDAVSLIAQAQAPAEGDKQSHGD
jgi:hypothetical protein